MAAIKTASSIAEQIIKLQSRGLIIEDLSFATYWIENVGYYRLSGYWWPMQTDKVNHVFKAGSRFESVIKLYQFDQELKHLVFDVIEKIEVSFRARLINVFSLAYEPNWFEQPSFFKNQKHFLKNLEIIDRDLNNSKEEFIQDHKNKHSTTLRPPSWKTLEILSLGHLSKLYNNLKDNSRKSLIANGFTLPTYDYLESWLTVMTDLRNICAHHSRLWNRSILSGIKPLKVNHPGWLSEYPQQDKNKIYLPLSSLAYLLHAIAADGQFKRGLKRLIACYPSVDIHAMGFPPHWENEPVWQS